MRRTAPFLLLLAWGLPAAAGQAPADEVAGAPPETDGTVVVGARATAIDGDPARFQRYGDRRDGLTLDRIWFRRDTATWRIRAVADRVGYRDQRIRLDAGRDGLFEARVDWRQMPLFESVDTRTPYREVSPGVFRLDDALQAAVQEGAEVSVLAPALRRFDLRSRRDVADVALDLTPAPDWSIEVGLTQQRRSGAQAQSAALGFGNTVELAVPVDRRTTDVRAAAEWSTRRAMARLAYDGSWFDQRTEALVWDNPLRLTDRTTSRAYITGDAASQGRLTLAPDSRAHTVSGTASVALPSRSRLTGQVSLGTWLQDAALLPHTINAAIDPVPLSRPSADAEARVVSMLYRLTSRPTAWLWMSGQYRLYDFDNRTPHFPVDEYVRLDGTLGASATGGNEPFSYERQFVDLDASVTPWRRVALRVGYGQERDRRTFRFFERTTEHVLRTSLDSTGLAWGVVRVEYLHAERTGEGLDEQVLSDVGEQVSLRRFDVSDRIRDQVTALVQMLPMAALGVTASVTAGREHRPDAAFGLQHNDVRAVTVSADLVPDDRVRVGASYGFERYATLQRSRQANPGPQFDDPTRDWSTDMQEDVHTAGVSIELPQLTRDLSLKAVYDYVRARATYVYLLPVDTTLASPEPLPPVRNEARQAGVEARYALGSQVSVVLGYRYDRYAVEDFARSPATLTSPLLPSFVNLTNWHRPYRAHSGSLQLAYAW